MGTPEPQRTPLQPTTQAMLLGTGLAFASLILVPALAHRLGVGTPLAGALRIALMRASSRAVAGQRDGGEIDTPCSSCH